MCLRRAEQLYLESFKLGIPDPPEKAAPGTIDTV